MFYQLSAEGDCPHLLSTQEPILSLENQSPCGQNIVKKKWDVVRKTLWQGNISSVFNNGKLVGWSNKALCTGKQNYEEIIDFPFISIGKYLYLWKRSTGIVGSKCETFALAETKNVEGQSAIFVWSKEQHFFMAFFRDGCLACNVTIWGCFSRCKHMAPPGTAKSKLENSRRFGGRAAES